MVTLLTKGLENKGLDYGTCNTFNSELHHPKKMSKGPTLLSCGIMEGDRWRDISRKSQIDLEHTTNELDSPWTCLTGSENCQENTVWPSDSNPASAVTSLIKDLSLSDRNGHPSAPPSKRQCRSLSFSDELTSCRSPWKPSGSKVWTPVDKRRCHSGSSVQPCSNGVSTMQRSSSFSLPSRCNVFSFSCEPLASSNSSVCPRGQGFWTAPTFGRFQDDLRPDSSSGVVSGVDLLRPLSLSHEQISGLEFGTPSLKSASAATPEPVQQTSRLLRSRSQPCVHNDQKVGMKRRRPDEDQRPSLDLAKMTQNLRNFHSPSSVGTTGNDCCQREQTISPSSTAAKTWTPHVYVSTPMPGTTPACSPEPQHHGDSEKPSTSKGETGRENTEVFGVVKQSWPSEKNDKDSWRREDAGQDVFQLDGELDIEQIENN
ncbi:protein FAM53B [Chiloscyllium plagiosum]|uniref:protein FAM53B n=1 Tax=Chiloscyllium plagiosum TaxID=36176 RepID=UPI001CB804AB|nr:protein FAM53B [Chiloscyllium plagiosum]XP_043568577.1 protein FAM53B [Chiloscyllium plagiosum]XP_043568578.1 protein FAM53B [Chiloscyllium plagiosum]